jgi:hypothetical protein
LWISVTVVAIQTLTALGIGSSPSQKLKDPLQRLGIHVTINAHATTARSRSFRPLRAAQVVKLRRLESRQMKQRNASAPSC